MTERNPHDSRLLVVLNANSTNAHKYHERFRNPILDSQWSKSLHGIFTQSPNQLDNEADIANELRDGDIVVGYGGDGLANTIANSIVLSGKSDTKSVFLPGGNGNDNSMALYGRKIKKFDNVLRLLNHGEVKPIDTIKVEKMCKGEVRHALGYVGFGLTANAAERIDAYNHRRSKKNSVLPDTVHDGVEVIKAVHEREPFSYTDIRTMCDGVDSKQAYDISFFNINRMAKALNIERQGSETITCIETSIDKFVLTTLSKLVRENFVGGLTGKEVEHRMIKFKTDTRMHCDGEASDVDAYDTYDVSHHPQTLDVLVFPDRN